MSPRLAQRLRQPGGSSDRAPWGAKELCPNGQHNRGVVSFMGERPRAALRLGKACAARDPGTAGYGSRWLPSGNGRRNRMSSSNHPPASQSVCRVRSAVHDVSHKLDGAAKWYWHLATNHADDAAVLSYDVRAPVREPSQLDHCRRSFSPDRERSRRRANMKPTVG